MTLCVREAFRERTYEAHSCPFIILRDSSEISNSDFLDPAAIFSQIYLHICLSIPIPFPFKNSIIVPSLLSYFPTFGRFYVAAFSPSARSLARRFSRFLGFGSRSRTEKTSPKWPGRMFFFSFREIEIRRPHSARDPSFLAPLRRVYSARTHTRTHVPVSPDAAVRFLEPRWFSAVGAFRFDWSRLLLFLRRPSARPSRRAADALRALVVYRVSFWVDGGLAELGKMNNFSLESLFNRTMKILWERRRINCRVSYSLLLFFTED